MTTFMAGDFDTLLHVPSRGDMVHSALDFATRDFVPPDGEERVDPLARLLDPTFTDVVWDYEHSYVGLLPGTLHPKQLEALHHPATHRWLFWGNQCTIAGTRVLTSRGMIPCEEIALGDVVLGPRGVLQPVVRTWQSPTPVPLFRLRTVRGYGVTGNAEHPVYVADAKAVGDWHGSAVPDEASGRFVPLSGVRPGQYVRLGMRSALGGGSDWPSVSPLTPDDGYFLGLMTGDGWWHHGTTGRMSLSSHAGDVATIEWVEAYLTSAHGIRSAREVRGDGHITLRWCNIAFKRRVESWGASLTLAGQKAVPEAVWRGTEEVARQFLRGLFDTDGCASGGRGEGRGPMVALVTTSPVLARDVHLLLLRWGIGATLAEDGREGTNFGRGARLFRLTMHGQKAARFKARIGFGLARKDAVLAAPSNRHNGAPRWDRIAAIEQAGEGTVYGFTCPPGHAFYAGGILNHNCGKTTLGAVDIALKALGRHPLQKTGRIAMPNQYTAWASALSWELWEKILLPELLTWLPRWRVLDAPAPFKKSTKRDIIILADNGTESRITGKAAEQGPGAYQSARLDDAWMDEEHPEEVYDELQPRLLRRGGRSIATMTPLKGLTYVHGRIYEPVRVGTIDHERHWYSHAGIRDNPSITPAARAEMLAELKHNPSQIAARDEGLFVRPFGSVLPWEPEKHTSAPSEERMILHRVRGAWYGALDLGKWRFAFVFGVANTDGEFLLVDEYFSQGEDADVRAKGMHDLLTSWKVRDIMIPADCADPQGIQELNDAFDRLRSPYRVYAIDGALKARTAGISRVESMLNRGAFTVRKGMAADRTWYYGRKASNMGRPVMGSRWMWEIANWQYPKTAEGKIQKDDPDDATADGADMMDATRYLIMSFFPADAPMKVKVRPTLAERLQKELEDMDRDEEQHAPGADSRYGGILRQ